MRGCTEAIITMNAPKLSAIVTLAMQAHQMIVIKQPVP
jgi:hypothetical protein